MVAETDQKCSVDPWIHWATGYRYLGKACRNAIIDATRQKYYFLVVPRDIVFCHNLLYSQEPRDQRGPRLIGALTRAMELDSKLDSFGCFNSLFEFMTKRKFQQWNMGSFTQYTEGERKHYEFWKQLIDRSFVSAQGLKKICNLFIECGDLEWHEQTLISLFEDIAYKIGFSGTAEQIQTIGILAYPSRNDPRARHLCVQIM